VIDPLEQSVGTLVLVFWVVFAGGGFFSQCLQHFIDQASRMALTFADIVQSCVRLAE